MAGFGSAVLEVLEDTPARVLRLGLPDRFIEHGKRELLLNDVGLTPERVAARTVRALREPSRMLIGEGSDARLAEGRTPLTSAVARSRLDQALVARGFFPSAPAAQAPVMAGLVRVDGRPVDKPGTGVAEDGGARRPPRTPATSSARRRSSSAGALDAFGVDVAGVDALDLGASTGGFTDCLLQRGAARVIALDVGYGQLDWGLRQDPRVR